MLKIIKRYSTLKQEIYILSNFIQPLPVIFFFSYTENKKVLIFLLLELVKQAHLKGFRTKESTIKIASPNTQELS